MAKLSVNVVRIESVFSHPNADRLDIIKLFGMGYQIITMRGNLEPGDLAFYFPIDSVIPDEWINKFNIGTYYSKKLKATKLRGIFSEGLLIKVSPEFYQFNPNIKVGDDYTDYYGVTKYEPPLQLGQGKNPNPIGVDRFPSPEHLKKYQDTFIEGEEIVITEKIHGQSSVWVYEGAEVKIASHNYFWEDNEENKKVPQIVCLKNSPELWLIPSGIKLYGEVYGKGIQDLNYGLETISYALFAVYKDDKFLDYQEFVDFCDYYNLRKVPELYRGIYNYNIIESFNNADSKISLISQMMEGICVIPIKERNNPKFGRVCMKYISSKYLLRKNGTENK